MVNEMEKKAQYEGSCGQGYYSQVQNRRSESCQIPGQTMSTAFSFLGQYKRCKHG